MYGGKLYMPQKAEKELDGQRRLRILLKFGLEESRPEGSDRSVLHVPDKELQVARQEAA